MVLNMAQTWHQLRPGEIRNDCGGCHAHSQAPTPFAKTAAARADYKVWDLVNQTPLVTAKAADQSGRQWDAEGAAGLRYARGVQSSEFHRDIAPFSSAVASPVTPRRQANRPATWRWTGLRR